MPANLAMYDTNNVENHQHNSLGLLNDLQSSPFAASPSHSSISMSHCHSMPSFAFAPSGLPQPASFGGRRGSVSSSASSCVSIGNTSEHGGAPESYSPRSFTPSESPLAMPSTLNSLSGLAIGTPETEGHFELSPSSHHTSFQPEQHNALFALSHGQDNVHFEMAPPPPPSFQIKRRAVQSFDAAMLSAHHTSDVQIPLGSSRPSESDGSEETTPMPASTGTFDGRSAPILSDGFRAVQVPVTPQTYIHRASFGQSSSVYGFTPGQSYSPSSTPDYSIRGESSDPASPLYVASAAGLRRLNSIDSIDSFQSDFDGAYGFDAQSKDGTPLLSLGDLQAHKQEPSFQENLAFRDHFQSPSGSQSHRTSLPGMSVAGMSAAVMARVASAPSSAAVPSLARSSTSSEASSFGSFPSTPSSSMASARTDGQVKDAIKYPSTPAHGLTSPGFDPYYSAPTISGHRSNSMITLGSPINDAVFSAMLDGRSRSISASVTRNTPRTRTRNAGPPPLIVSSADKLHVCHCGKRFKRMEHLKRHNRTHTQERPHKCPVETCGKFFGRSDNLAQHLKTHFRPAGLVGRSSELLSLTTGTDKFKHSEPRHDPHAAAAAAAHAAAQAADAINGKRGSVSQSCLGGPIALSKPTTPRRVLAPTGGISANSSPTMPTSLTGMQVSPHFV